MDEKQKEPKKRLSLFERIKESVLGVSEPEKEEVVKIPINVPAPGEVPDVFTPDALNIPTNSLLYSLWHEWNLALDGEPRDSEREHSHDGEYGPLEIIMEGTEDLPLSKEEIESERQRATVSLFARAKKNHMITRANEEGEIPSVDAEAVVHVARKRMAAWAFVFPPTGEGGPLTKQELELALAECTVCAGLDEEALNKIVEEQPYFKLMLIARGKPMVPGKDGYVVENYPRSIEKTFSMDEMGNVDYRAQNYVQIIHTGDVLCEAIAPTPGEDGLDVLGTVIPAKEGKEAKLLLGQNTALSEDKTKVIASMEGHLRFQEGKFHVKPTFHVPGDVDFNVGNIDFLGDVHVKGDVREGFVIKATGTVTVEGLVEGAVIEADGDVIISNGILGDDKAVIKAGGLVQAEYIENCIVYAGESVRGSSIVGSHINCDGTIVVRSGRGTIVGGYLIAAKKIDAKAIGSRAERLTSLSVGKLPYIRKRKEELEGSLEEVQGEMAEVERTIEYLDRTAGSDPEKIQRVADFRLQKSVLSMQIAHMQNKLQEIEEKDKDKDDEMISGCKVVASTIYPGVQIEIQDLSYTVQEENRNVKIHVQLGEIVLR